MHYNAFYYLASKVVSDYKASLPVDEQQLKAYLVELLSRMKNIQVDESIPDTWRDYARTANLLVLLQQTKLPPELNDNLQLLKVVALIERHVADFYLTAMVGSIKTAKDQMAATVVNDIFLQEGNIESLSKITDGTTNLCDKLQSLAEPITYAGVKKILDDMLVVVKQKRIAAKDVAAKNEFSRMCGGIINYYIPQLVTNVKNHIIKQCQPQSAFTDSDITALFAEFDQYQLRNIVEFYIMNIKGIPLESVDKSIGKLKSEWAVIEKNVAAGHFSNAAKLILDFHRGADLKYRELFEDDDVAESLQFFTQCLCAICDLQTPALRKAIAESHALFYLRAAVSLDAGKDDTSSPLQALLNILPQVSEQDYNDLAQVAEKIRTVFKEKPYARFSDLAAGDLWELRQLIDRCGLYDKQRMTVTILQSNVKEATEAAKKVRVLLDEMANVSDHLAVKFAENHALEQRDRLFVNLPNDLHLASNDSLRQELERIADAKSTYDLLSYFKKVLFTIGLEINHNEMTILERQSIAICCILKKYKALIAKKDFSSTSIIRRHLFVMLHRLYPDEKVLCLVDMMHEQLVQFSDEQAKNPQAQHAKRVEYIIGRLTRIANRMCQKIPENKRVYYADAAHYSPGAIMVDIVQQLHKELILLQHSTLKADTSSWTEYGKSIWYGDDRKALQVLLEEMLMEYDNYFPMECQGIARAMQTLRNYLGVNNLLRDSKKCNAAQQKREPDNELLKQALTY